MSKFLREILQNKCLNTFEWYCLVTSTLCLTKNFVWWYISGRKVQRDDILWKDKDCVFKTNLEVNLRGGESCCLISSLKKKHFI